MRDIFNKWESWQEKIINTFQSFSDRGNICSKNLQPFTKPNNCNYNMNAGLLKNMFVFDFRFGDFLLEKWAS